MYNRVGRGLLIVGRQFRHKLCENANTATGAEGCAATSAVQCAQNNFIVHRSYCNNDSNESTTTPPQLISPNEEAESKLTEMLTNSEYVRLQKIIELEIDVLRQNNDKVPATLQPRHWFELLNLDSRNKRKRYLEFIWGLEKKHENLRKAKDEKLRKHEEKLANPSEDPTEFTYQLGKNSMFIRFYDSTINHMWNNRLMQRMLFGQQIVLDCSYEEYMTKREKQNCAKQMQLSFAVNRFHDDPFDLYLCNANLQGDLMKFFHRFIPPVYNPDFPLNIRSESYLDIFDKKKLIYLSPHAQTEMTEFDHDAVYIIGAFVDKSSNEPISKAKAKKEGLTMLKFPLDRYLQWGMSSGKNLTVNQVTNILLDLRLTGSWDKALTSVPRRKLLEFRTNSAERSLDRMLSPKHTGNEENYTSPVQELKLKDKFIYKPDRSHRPKTNSVTRETQQDFTMKSRAKFRNDWKN